MAAEISSLISQHVAMGKLINESIIYLCLGWQNVKSISDKEVNNIVL